MTLEQWLNRIPDNKMLAVGSKSAFFFIGPKYELRAELSHLDEIHMSRVNDYISKVNASVKRIEAYIETNGATKVHSKELRLKKNHLKNLMKYRDNYKAIAGEVECLVCDPEFDDRWTDKEIDQLDEIMREDGKGWVTEEMRKKLKGESK